MKLVGLFGTKSGASGGNGLMTVPLPPFVARSRPWSKNCPKNVNIRLKGAERPKSGVMFGMKSAPESGSSGVGSEHTKPPPAHGWSAALAAAWLALDWSMIRLLMMRGCESKTLVSVFVAYEVPCSAGRNLGVVRRGKSRSADPKRR